MGKENSAANKDDKAAIEQLADKASAARGKIEERAHQLLDDLKDLSDDERQAAWKILSEGQSRLESGTKAAREKLHQLKEKAGERYEQASHKVHDAYERAADTSLRDVEQSVGNYVKEKPGKSLLIAMGAGLLAGMLLRGGRH